MSLNCALAEQHRRRARLQRVETRTIVTCRDSRLLVARKGRVLACERAGNGACNEVRSGGASALFSIYKYSPTTHTALLHTMGGGTMQEA